MLSAICRKRPSTSGRPVLLIAGIHTRAEGSRRLCGLRVAAAILLAAVSVGTTACGSEALRPENVTATGRWIVNIDLVRSEFVFDIVEDERGIITGTWSNSDHFYQYALSGRRDGLNVSITADSPNIFIATLAVAFVTPKKLEGVLDFGHKHHTVTLIPE